MHHPNAVNELTTLRDWLRFTVSQFEQHPVFFGHGTDNSYDEAVWLILGALKLPSESLASFLDAKLTKSEREHLYNLIDQRINNNTPTAYLLNEAWLYDFKFYVDKRVIVPRSFIAQLLLDDSLTPWIEFPEMIKSAADICTGSGCLGVLLANAFPNAAIDVIDISPDAIAVSHINIANYDLQERVSAIKSDMFSALKGKTYDLIISNPPYINKDAMRKLPNEYRNEPQIALGSGPDGLDHTRTILREAKNYLSDQGILIVEIGHNRDALIAAYPNIAFTWLEVDSGSDFVFMLTKSQLLQQ